MSDYRHVAVFGWNTHQTVPIDPSLPRIGLTSSRQPILIAAKTYTFDARRANSARSIGDTLTTREEMPYLMPNYLELPIGPRSPEVINAVIEIPHEGINKYEYDKELHVFRLDRNLYSPVHYPGDYGFFPSTLGDDGDPLDCLVLVDAPSFPGCVMEVRPIGVLEMLDQGLGDEKVLCVGEGNPRYKDVWNYSEIYPHMLREITHFFAIYKDLEGKRVEVKGWRDASFARAKVQEAQQRFIDNKANPQPKPVPQK